MTAEDDVMSRKTEAAKRFWMERADHELCSVIIVELRMLGLIDSLGDRVGPDRGTDHDAKRARSPPVGDGPDG